MTLQHRIDDRHLATARQASDSARRSVEAAVGRLAKARGENTDPDWILACLRELRVAGQRQAEAAEVIAAAQLEMGREALPGRS